MTLLFNRAYFEEIYLDLVRLILPFFTLDEQKTAAEYLYNIMLELAQSTNDLLYSKELVRSTPEGFGSPLASPKNFYETRRLWLDNKITGISADWFGSVHKKIAVIAAKMGEVVKVIYPSNILEHATLRSRDTLTNFSKGLCTLPTDADSKVVYTAVGGQASTICGVSDLQRFIGEPQELTEAEGRFTILRAIAQRITLHLDRGSFFDVPASSLLRAVDQACTTLEAKGDLNESDLNHIATDYNLSPNDIWRFRFSLKKLGLIDY